jgi:hypothetical protein
MLLRSTVCSRPLVPMANLFRTCLQPRSLKDTSLKDTHHPAFIQPWKKIEASTLTWTEGSESFSEFLASTMLVALPKSFG